MERHEFGEQSTVEYMSDGSEVVIHSLGHVSELQQSAWSRHLQLSDAGRSWTLRKRDRGDPFAGSLTCLTYGNRIRVQLLEAPALQTRSSSSSGRGIKRDRSGSSKASTSKAADLALLDDLANKDVFDALVKEEEDLEAAAGIDLNLEDGTAAEVPVTQDKEIYRWIVEELWRVAVQRFDAGEVS